MRFVCKKLNYIIYLDDIWKNFVFNEMKENLDIWWINTNYFVIKKPFEGVENEENKEENIKNYSENFKQKIEIKYNKEEDELRDKNYFTIEKFEKLNLNETKKLWYIFYRNFINPQTRKIKELENFFIENFSSCNKIDKNNLGINLDPFKKFISTSLFIDTRNLKCEIGMSKFGGKKIKIKTKNIFNLK
jgi:hypothetical protein